MVETDLERLLEDGARRLRLQRALRFGLAALGCGVLLAALAIFLLRMFPLQGAMPGLQMAMLQLAIALPVVLTAIVAAAAYQFTQPELSAVALLLDRRAESKEHLVTWFECRQCGRGKVNPEFSAAQLGATLQRAQSMNPRKLLPLRLPDWSRALWLALLLLCSALLMPPRAEATRGGQVRDARAVASLQRRQFAPAEAGPAENKQMPRVQPLSPTDLMKFQLSATDSELPKEVKAELYKELQSKIGNIPESELAPEVAEILNSLRKDSGAKVDENKKLDEKNGTQQSTGSGSKNEANTATEVGVPVNVQFSEKVFTQIGQSFPDVKEQLERYYKPQSTDERR